MGVVLIFIVGAWLLGGFDWQGGGE